MSPAASARPRNKTRTPTGGGGGGGGTLTALFVVGNAASLTASDTAWRTLFQTTLGYTVTLRSYSATQDTAAYSVVVILPSVVDTGTFQGKYSTHTSPVLNLCGWSWAWWYAIAGDSSITFREGTAYVRSTHPANGGLAVGWHNISNTPAAADQIFQVVNVTGDKMPAGATVIQMGTASDFQYVTGIAFERSASLFGGRSTPSRWVMLGWQEPVAVNGLTAAAIDIVEGALSWLQSTTGTPPPPPPPPIGEPQSVFFPDAIPIWEGEIINSYRGQYEWIVQNDLKPSWWPWLDSYDRLGWWQLEEAGEGQYNFIDIEVRLQLAAARKGRHSLGIMTCLSYDYGTYIWHNGGSAYTFHGGVQVPQYIRDSIGGWQRGSAWFPDWNDPYYLSRWEALMMALGDEYRDDPRFGYMDIRGYGDFGEWHLFGLDDVVGGITDANARRIVDATVDAFRGADGKLSKFCLMLVAHDHALRHAVALDPKVGMRADGLGSYLGPSAGYAEPASHPARQKWTTAPFITEWIGDVSDLQTYYSRGLQNVYDYHISGLSGGNIEADPNVGSYPDYEESIKRSGYRVELREVQVGGASPGGTWSISSRWGNIGVNPPYDDWILKWELRSGGGAIVQSWNSTLNLKSILPGETTHLDGLVIPGGLATGVYELTLRIVDPVAYLDPMRLATEGRESDGRYSLGLISVS